MRLAIEISPCNSNFENAFVVGALFMEELGVRTL
jgi:hypothetical protein